ncbi:Alpha/Beta hydrolase protein [Suillus subluteus]|nr:Alpha/Beta hydrolase protein [Suillus subluteus]
MNYLENEATTCNYTGYIDKHVTYPPTGLLPLPGDSIEFAEGCNVWHDIFYSALIINPAFDAYHIWDTTQSPIYFNRMDVKEAIHAPVDTKWSESSNVNVFPNGDSSLPPAFTVLLNVIEKNKQTVIIHGLANFVLISECMTWNRLQGFQTPIINDNFIVNGMGAFRTMHSEQGLTYYEVVLSGHMVPQFSPVAAFQIMQYLMGFRDMP